MQVVSFSKSTLAPCCVSRSASGIATTRNGDKYDAYYGIIEFTDGEDAIGRTVVKVRKTVTMQLSAFEGIPQRSEFFAYLDKEGNITKLKCTKPLCNVKKNEIYTI